MPTYDITVELVGTDGNAFALISKVDRAIRRQVGSAEAKAFREEALKAQSYDDLLAFLADTVEVL